MFDLAHKQCNGIIKGWLHSVTSDSKGRFANNILLPWYPVMVQSQFSLMKRNKDWTSRTLASRLFGQSKNVFKLLDCWSRDMLNFDFQEKILGLNLYLGLLLIFLIWWIKKPMMDICNKWEPLYQNATFVLKKLISGQLGV